MELDDLNARYQDNLGGGQTEIGVANLDDIETWPTLGTSTGALTGLQVYTGSFTMKAGKRFYRLRATENTVNLTSNDQGETDGMSQQDVLQFFHPQNVAGLLGFVRRSNNGAFVFVIKDKEGIMRVVGSETCGAYKVPQNTTLGGTAADRKGATLSFACDAHGPSPIYSGTIPYTASGSGSGA